MESIRNDVFDAQACGSLTPKSKPCPRPKPGEAAGGCSFDGAQITLLPIMDAAHLVHGLTKLVPGIAGKVEGLCQAGHHFHNTDLLQISTITTLFLAEKRNLKIALTILPGALCLRQYLYMRPV